MILLMANVLLFVLVNWFAPANSGQTREEINADKIRVLDAN